MPEKLTKAQKNSRSLQAVGAYYITKELLQDLVFQGEARTALFAAHDAAKKIAEEYGVVFFERSGAKLNVTPSSSAGSPGDA